MDSYSLWKSLSYQLGKNIKRIWVYGSTFSVRKEDNSTTTPTPPEKKNLVFSFVESDALCESYLI